MSAAAAASSRPRSLNHLTTRRRTVSVRAARSAAVIDRAGRNTGGASAPCRNTPSVTHACRWTWRLRAEPKRWTKETAPSRGRAVLGVSSSHVAPAAAISSRSTPVRKILVSEVTASGRSARKQRSRQLRAPPLGHGDHPLAHGHRWDDMINSGGLRSAPCVGHYTTDSRLFPCTRTPPQIPGRSPYT